MNSECATCVTTKLKETHVRSVISRTIVSKTTHADISGPMSNKSLKEYQFVVLVLEDHLHVAVVIIVDNENEMSELMP